MERKYKAFISYRHLPLQMDVAKTLHKRIERYVIPKALRKNGGRRVGLVFRDQDELPISSSLTANIEEALDNAEFLIVICTPETAQSRWVLREISYFLEHHDRDHVLAVLADGAPEDAFPAQLTEIQDENGTLVSRVEPLAANIVAPTQARRRRLLKAESLRILAALIGCPYDTLYRREQRYRYRRLAAAAAVVLSLAAAFVGMLLNRNAHIREQFLAAQINESRALAALSWSAYREGDYNGAIRAALDALPSEDEPRPYVAEAEYVLSRELNLYAWNELEYDQSFEQPTAIAGLLLSEDGRLLATSDAYRTLRVFDTYSGTLLWEYTAQQDSSFRFAGGLDAVYYDQTLFSARTGERLWAFEERMDYVAFSSDVTQMIGLRRVDDRYRLFLIDLAAGTALRSVPVETDAFIRSLAVSDDGRYAAMTDSDNRLYLFDFASLGSRLIDELETDSVLIDRVLRFMDNDDLIVACAGEFDVEGSVAVYDRENDWRLRFSTTPDFDKTAGLSKGGRTYLGAVDVLCFNQDRIAFGTLKNLFLLDRETGEITADIALPDILTYCKLYDNGSLGVMLSNGLITGCTGDGLLTCDIDMYYRDTDNALRGGGLVGEKLLKSTFVVVTAADSNRASILRWRTGEELSPVFEDMADLEDSRLYVSPSGRQMAALRYDYDKNTLQCTLWRRGEEEQAKTGVLTDLYFTHDDRDCFVTEDGKIIAGGCVYDVIGGSCCGLTGDGSLPSTIDYYAAVDCPEDGTVLSAALERQSRDAAARLSVWKDTTLLCTSELPASYPSSEAAPYCCAVSPAGWAVTARKLYLDDTDDGSGGFAYCIPENRWTPLPLLDSSYADCCAVAEKDSLLAIPSAEGGLLLMELTDGSVRRSIPCSFPPSSVTKLLFAAEDRILLVFSAAGGLQIFDTQTGELLNSLDFGENLLSFHRGAKYSAVFTADGRELLVFDIDRNYTTPAFLRLETEGWNCVSMITGPLCYYPESGELLIRPERSGYYYAHYLSREELIARGEAILGREPAGTAAN